MDVHNVKITAFKQLLGLASLPHNGAAALEASKRFSQTVLSTISPDPLLHHVVAEHGVTSAKQRFVDVPSGMRLRYLEWGAGGDDVVILLHDTAESANSWQEVAPGLSDRGYRVLALDLRGHGGSSHSPGGRYAAEQLAEDVQGFITALDLYVRPVAVVGSGIGAVVAFTLACAAPGLVGSVAAVEFGLPPAAITAAAAALVACPPDPAGHAAVIAPPQPSGEAVPRLDSAQLLPWWSFWLGQGAEFWSAAECAAFLASPLPNFGPCTLPHLAAALAAAQPAAERTHQQAPQQAVSLAEALEGLARPPGRAAAAAAAMLQPSLGGWQGGGDGATSLRLRVDPKFFFSFNVAELVHGLALLRCPLLVAYSARSAWVPPEDAAALAAAAPAAASSTVEALPQGSHHPATDCPRELLKRLVAFLEGPAVECFEPAEGGAAARRPESLGLRPLPQYRSVEEAQRALGPRRVPTAAVVEGELAKLRLEAGHGGAGDDDEGSAAPEYFGFVG